MRTHCAQQAPRAMTTKFVRLSTRCALNDAGSKNSLPISGTMLSPNILVACKHPYLLIRKNKLNRQHALVEYNQFLTELVNNECCVNINVSKSTPTKCCCLHDLRGGEGQERLAYAAEHMWYFHNLNRI
mgnify:CR=1 FL=1